MTSKIPTHCAETSQQKQLWSLFGKTSGDLRVKQRNKEGTGVIIAPGEDGSVCVCLGVGSGLPVYCNNRAVLAPTRRSADSAQVRPVPKCAKR